MELKVTAVPTHGEAVSQSERSVIIILANPKSSQVNLTPGDSAFKKHGKDDFFSDVMRFFFKMDLFHKDIFGKKDRAVVYPYMYRVIQKRVFAMEY